ncbi:hypothetical protein BKA70DRAFT_1307244 [Coprinopsis sp. MPI-PUGE-AT-0042]|nr:hypothetical protein BKA70DRAFT_1307244 [Coprinopsis sp. MPI-PUGE-AT-0042]
MSNSGTLQVADIPPEIWLIVFRLVLGSDPFGREERRAYTHLRSACSTWRRILASAHGLCSGLELDLAIWAGDLEGGNSFKARLSPWLAIISQNRPYHLTIAPGESLELDMYISMVRYLLCEATPTPTTLSIDSFKVADSIFCLGDTCTSVIHLNVDSYDYLGDCDIYSLPLEFPQLQSFAARARTRFDTQIRHPHLQSLTLLDVVGASEDFALLCVDLPCLREARISCEDMYELADPINPLKAPLTHLALEVILLEGEDIIPLLAHLTLPSLKFLGMEAWGKSNGAEILESTLPAFIQRSRLSNLPVSLKGSCPAPLFASLTRSLPPATTLLLNFHFTENEGPEEEDYWERISPTVTFRNINEMISLDLDWVHECRALSLHGHGIKIYAPADALQKDEVGSLRKELTDKGFVLEKCTPDVMDGILSSTVPQMTISWEV